MFAFVAYAFVGWLMSFLFCLAGAIALDEIPTKRTARDYDAVYRVLRHAHHPIINLLVLAYWTAFSSKSHWKAP